MPDEPVYDLTCSGPGPHEPPDGVLGTSSVPNATGICALCALIPPELPPPPVDLAVDLATTMAVVNTMWHQLAANSFIDPNLLVLPE